ncbi:MAG: DNA/RNA non-specific endonuclease [Desulfobacteraceae bacterium]|nr:DNA/RNA non-specific endonuclease [Desulfobacteraceae bacterium]
MHIIRKVKISIICCCSLFYLLLPSIVVAQAFNYLPAEVSGHQKLPYTQFTLSYSEEHEQPDWVAYELTDDEVAMSQDRCNCFAKDDNVITGSATKADYSSTGFDRGHLCPAADNKMSELANRESFLLSNMSPQLPIFNRGIWAELESWVRDQAEIYSTIYIVTGPVFVNNLGTLGNNKVTIPGYFYKALLRFDGTKAKTIGFLLPQVGATGQIKDYIVTVNTLETLTGLDFYPELSSSVENRVESQYELKKWGF